MYKPMGPEAKPPLKSMEKSNFVRGPAEELRCSASGRISYPLAATASDRIELLLIPDACAANTGDDYYSNSSSSSCAERPHG
jgi:hypothetical protein